MPGAAFGSNGFMPRASPICRRFVRRVDRSAEMVRRFVRSHRRLGDQDMRSELPEEDDFVLVDLSWNFFGHEGLSLITSFCQRQWKLQILKLHHCHIKDDCAEVLGGLLMKNPLLDELHLSHNSIAASGALYLVRAVERGRALHQSPLWLRLEHNRIEGAEDLLYDLQQQGSVCGFHPRRCNARSCGENRKIHLPYFTHQDGQSARPTSPDRSDVSDASSYERDPWWGQRIDDLPRTPRRTDAARNRSRSAAARPSYRRAEAEGGGGVRPCLSVRELLAWEEELMARQRQLDEMERRALARQEATQARSLHRR